MLKNTGYLRGIMAKSSTSFGKDSQPKNRRGKSQKTIILEAIREQSLIGLSPDATRDEVEKAFIAHTASRALNPNDKQSSMLLGILWNKGWKNIKTSNDCVEFDFNEKAKPAEQAAQILKAASSGQIPPDVANIFIQSIASMLKIEEITEIQRRLEELEKAMGVSNG